MKRKFITIVGLTVLFLSSKSVFSGNQITLTNPELYKEKVELVTDRDIYVVSETINFVVFNLSQVFLKEAEWSKVIYLELISFDGKPLLQAKYPFNKKGSKGSFQIPRSILTGHYYIKTYTRWMRNYGPLTYSYTPITIINPYHSELITEPTSYISNFVLDTVRNGNLNNDTFLGVEDTLEPNKYYTIHKSKLIVSEFEPSSVSIIKKTTFCFNKTKVRVLNELFEFNLFYMPETRSISLSGTLLDNKIQQPLSYAIVSLTILNKQSQSLSVFTDSSGRFFFSLPELSGEKEIIITTDSQQDKDILIRVDNDFCTRTVCLPYIPFKLDENARQAFNELVVDFQIQQQFQSTKDSNDQESEGKFEIQYFAKPTISVKLDEYISLPSLNDYFHELIPLVGFKKIDGKKRMQVYGPSYDLRIYEPLVMIDHVVYTDIDKLLAIPPSKIDKIEVLNSPYIKGNRTYGGVVSIFSKEGDLKGINLPENSRLFNIKMFGDSIIFTNSANANEKQPIIGNSIGWFVDCFDSSCPDKTNFQNTIQTLENQELKINETQPIFEIKPIPFSEIGKTNDYMFYTGDNYGDYLLVYSMSTPNGIKQRVTNISIK